MGNEVKSEQLGMSFGAANGILRKAIMFKYVCLAGDDICYKCGTKIESVDDISIEHKSVWLHTENPVERFFDLDNIAFSHLWCNKTERPEFSRAAMASKAKAIWDDRSNRGVNYCVRCRQELPVDNFSTNSYNANGIHHECKSCRRKLRNKGA